MRLQRRPIVAALLLVGGVTGLPTATSSGADRFVYQSTPLAPLIDSKTYVLHGIRTADGCLFDYPPLTVRAGDPARMQRDIGIDLVACAKLVEEGIPTVTDFPAADSSLRAAVGSTRQATSVVATTATLVGHSGNVQVWWVDQPGYLLNGDTTYISWITNGSCSTSGNASGEWTWRSGTGWRLRGYGGTDSLTCSRYMGETNSWFDNPGVFCPSAYVSTYYNYVRAFGWYNGSLTGDWSSQTYNACLPVYERHSVNPTG